MARVKSSDSDQISPRAVGSAREREDAKIESERERERERRFVNLPPPKSRKSYQEKKEECRG